jgi:hypothetical protein
MPLTAGRASSGKGGAFAELSLAASGTQYNMAAAQMNYDTVRGDAVIDLLNNEWFAANYVQGLTVGRFSIAMPYIPVQMPADFWTRAFFSVFGDTDGPLAGGTYHTLTVWPDAAGSAAVVYGNCKYAGFSFQVMFDPNGAVQTFGISMTGLSQDPESGSVSALSTPTTGALTVGNAKGFAQTTFTGATNVVGIQGNISCGLVPTEGVVAGTNTIYPYNIAGLMQTDLSGTVTITQKRSAATVLGATATGAPTALIMAIGSTGQGATWTLGLKSISKSLPSNLGKNYMRNVYQLLSVDGTTSPLTIADL